MNTLEMYKDLKNGSEDFAPYRDRILFRVIAEKRARKMGLARLKLYDLAVVFEIPPDEAEIRLAGEKEAERGLIRNATALISELQAVLWGVTPAQLYEHALPNTQKARPLKAGSIYDIMRELEPSLPEPPAEIVKADPLYTVTNKGMYMGFGAIFYPGVLEGLQKSMGKFWVIPSSVHEALILPADVSVPADHIPDMIRWVNEEEVQEHERLSDSLYFYNPEAMEIERYEPAADTHY